jgi:nucleoside-diphosphate-sugar epimerase
MSATILITGAAGYVGSILCETLLSAGHRVIALDKMSFEPSLFHLCANPCFDFIFGDVRDERVLAKAMQSADVIIPLAALVGAPLCARDPWTATSVNLEAVRLVTRLRSPRQLIIYPTTNSGYGTKSGDVHCTEETHFVYAAVTDGYLVVFEKGFQRNFVHIRDVADCFAFCIENHEEMIGRPFNLGLDSANLSKEGLAEKVKQHVPGFFVHYSEIGVDPDKRNYFVSNQRLREAGFEAKRSLDDGITELLKGYRMLGRGRFQNV